MILQRARQRIWIVIPSIFREEKEEIRVLVSLLEERTRYIWSEADKKRRNRGGFDLTIPVSSRTKITRPVSIAVVGIIIREHGEEGDDRQLEHRVFGGQASRQWALHQRGQIWHMAPETRRHHWKFRQRLPGAFLLPLTVSFPCCITAGHV